MSKTARCVLLAGLLMFVVYPLSYAPIDRFITGGQLFELDSEYRMPVYRPVTLLIDYTPARVPLLRWSRLFGLEWRHRTESYIRQQERRQVVSVWSAAAEG